ncbi:hypothetical protein AeNC1_013054 [Aphanomyces euteiches]|nr:hypothetical protein AeRB84_019312 [Aphanomyces euteiches]KAH9184970.1 hypothetical protein AeNC1_013054 [Aphanomyces euteiches]
MLDEVDADPSQGKAAKAVSESRSAERSPKLAENIMGEPQNGPTAAKWNLEPFLQLRRWRRAAAAPPSWKTKMPAIATPSPYDDIPHLKTFERVVQIELENVQGCEEQFLRSSTGLSSEMKDLGHKYGQKYFSFLLSGALCSSSRLGDLNRDQVMGLATDIIHRMVSSLDKYAPYVLRLSCAYILEKFEAAFPNSTRGPTIVVGGCIILRIVCPALIKPELMGFEPHTPRTLPNALLLAKLLQHAMRGTVFDMSSDELYYANDFIATTKDLVAGYLRAFPSTTKHVLIERLGDAPSTQQDTELRDIQALEPRRRPTTAIIIKSPKESCEDSPKRRFSLLSLFKTKSSGPTTPPATPRCRHCGK